MQRKKIQLKYIALLFVPIIFFLIGNLVNLYWLPADIRVLLIYPKFSERECIAATSIWGVNPKVVLNLKVEKGEIVYVLQDADRHGHIQFMKKLVVEKYAVKINCPR